MLRVCSDTSEKLVNSANLHGEDVHWRKEVLAGEYKFSTVRLHSGCIIPTANSS